jgi:hypothetical protein
MSNKSKAAALLAAGISRKSYSIPEICARNGISQGLYEKLKKLGLGPQETNLLDRIVVTDDAEADWLRKRAATAAETDTPYLKQRA